MVWFLHPAYSNEQRTFSNMKMKPESLYTDILDNLKTAILLLDPNLSITYLNSSAEILMETSGSRVLGETITSLFTEDSDDKNNLMVMIKDLSAFTKREAQLTLPSQQTITVDCAVTPIIKGDETISLIMELQPLDRLIRISREEGILSSQQHAQALIRGLAHEIKNPLGGLRGAAQLLARELPSASLKEYTDVIIEEADRLGNLLDRMLGSNSLLDFQTLNIHEVLERVRSLINAETSGSIRVIIDYDPSIPELSADKERLIQATLNIARNAMQALQSNENTSDPTITLKTRTRRQFTIGNKRHKLVCHVAISDNGPGIPKELIDTIFLPMISGRAEGTGLGLSISQSMINHHQGLIECTSQSGCTTFDLFIPLQKSLESNMEQK
ncbi:MAG: two-component system nitrogen regulation sensor histidine kinase GlnL [Oceanicoccus sp.]|jgi:two-component system nitrogen regulation sensor histidine kinase GlnL